MVRLIPRTTQAFRAGLPGVIALAHESEGAAILCFAEDHEYQVRAFEELRTPTSREGLFPDVHVKPPKSHVEFAKTKYSHRTQS